jgi:CubicO group peptidase (beta-lactamase class C family)
MKPTPSILVVAALLLCPRLAAAFESSTPAQIQSPPAASAVVQDYFPPPESQGGWRKLDQPDDLRRLTLTDPAKLTALRDWLLQSDDRNFAAVVIRNGYIVLEVERGNSAKTDSRRVASVSKAVCATVLAIASEQSQQGRTRRRMKFDDPAFDYIPWAEPLSDPRKAQITVKQLLNHTSGICPEATGAPNDSSWEYILGLTGDPRTAKLAFDPGTGCGYSTHALAHAALVCETVTGQPYDQFAIAALFKPLGVEHWWFQYYAGNEKIGRHPSHGLGMPARDLARIGYCMMRGGRWGGQQVVPKWFVAETAAPTHSVTSPEMRWKLNPQIFSHGWELPARHQGASGRSGEGIPADARYKPGSGGQLIAFVPSLDLVITRQTGGSGEWEFEEYLRRACSCIISDAVDIQFRPQFIDRSLPVTDKLVGDYEPSAVPTFECMGLYWKAPDGASDRPCEVNYRASGEPGWRSGLPLWFDARNQEYRGSLVQLRPGTRYEITLQLKGTTTHSSLQAQTWSETFPVGKTVVLPDQSHDTLTIAESGAPNGFVVYAPGTNAGTYDLSSAPITAADTQEKHGIRGVPEFVPGYGFQNGKGVFALATKSPGFDAGIVIPNFNDGFTGAAPDLGAHEAGTEPMEFGVNAYRAAKPPGGR